MKRTTRLPVAGGLLLAAVVVFLLSWLMYRSDTAFARRAVRTDATVERVTPARIGDFRGTRTDDSAERLVVGYRVAGRAVRATLAITDSGHRVGQMIKIGYDPRDVTYAVSPPPGSGPETGDWVLGALGVGLLVAAFAAAIRD